MSSPRQCVRPIGASNRLTVAGAMAALGCGLFSTIDMPVVAQSVNLSAIFAGSGSGFSIDGEDVSNKSGLRVASAGDVNGDGLADVIIGAPFFSPPGRPFAGRSYVVFGKSTPTGIDLSAVGTGTSTLGFVINGEALLDTSGYSVSSAGDVNGDGLADVIVGAYRAADAGRSYVVFGKSSSSAVELSDAATGTSSLGFVINGQAFGDRSGRSVSCAGDVNGDGLSDLLVGAIFSDTANGTNAGRGYVVFGKVATGAVNLSAIATGTSSMGYMFNGQATNDYAGWSVASAGDVNGDGLSDVIVGAAGSNPAAGTNAGRTYVIFGKTGPTSIDLSSISTGTSPLGFVINGQAPFEGAGFSVSSGGDVNGDGLSDIIVGARYSDPAAGTDAGRSYVVFGKATLSPVDVSAISTGTSALGFAINGQAVSDASGFSVSSAGDLNGDGLADVIVGAPGSDPSAGNSAGRSYVVLGRTTTGTVDLSAIATGTSSLGFVINGQSQFDLSGSAVSAAGDVNGDGVGDLVVGAPEASTPGGDEAGRSYVIFSPLTPAASGTYRGIVAAGNPDRQGIGVHRFGDDEVIFPDSRLWVDFSAGTGPGLASSSQVTATITRNDAGLTGLNPANTANVQWQVSTNRSSWGTCRVTIRYTNAEIAGLTEGALVLYSAPTAAGPFTATGAFALNAARNEASGDIASLPRVFVLSTVPPVPVGPANGDANNDGVINVADVTAIHNLLAGVVPPPLPGDGDVNNTGGVTLTDAELLRNHLVNGTPLP